MAVKDINLLVVDDDKDILLEVISIVKGKNYDVLYAPNGRDGVGLAIEELPELILMDWDMPIMNGIDAIKQLKNNGATKSIPIIMMTGINTSSRNLSEAIDSGAVDFLSKPFDELVFHARVANVLRTENLHKENIKLLAREKDAFKAEKEARERELVLMSTQEIRINEILMTLAIQLERLNSLTKFTLATDIKQIETEISAILKSENAWDDFKIRFEQLNPNFFTTLDHNGPGLTVNEKKLAAYLKMGKSNYEIATLCGISNSSVSKSLYRMKKKMKLDKSEDLRHHFDAKY